MLTRCGRDKVTSILKTTFLIAFLTSGQILIRYINLHIWKLIWKCRLEMGAMLSWLQCFEGRQNGCPFQDDILKLILLYGNVLSIFSCDQAALWMVQSVRLSVCPSVCPSVRPSHLFDYVPINVSSWNFQELLPMTKVTSMQKVKVRGQRSRSQRSRPNLTVSGL